MTKLGWIYLAFALATLVIFAGLWRFLDSGWIAILLIVYPLVYFVGGYFAHYLKSKAASERIK